MDKIKWELRHFMVQQKKALTHFSSSDSLGSVLMEVDVLKSCHFTSDKQIVNSTSAVGQFSVSAKKA